MHTYEKLRIPHAEFQALGESEKISLFTKILGKVGLTSTQLLYSGIEGKSLMYSSDQEERFMTFAVSYRKLSESAKEIDETGWTDVFGYPLMYAIRPGVEVPAVAVYDRSQMLPAHPEEDEDWDWLEEWLHKDGQPVNDALKAVIFFDK